MKDPPNSDLHSTGSSDSAPPRSSEFQSSSDITGYLPSLKDDDGRAQAAVTKKLLPRLTRLANWIMKRRGVETQTRDGEDVALSAMCSVFQWIASGAASDLDSSAQLKNILKTVIRRKVSGKRRYDQAQRRGGNGESKASTIRESSAEGDDNRGWLGQIAGNEPPPEFCSMYKEVIRSLTRRQKQIIEMRLTGHSNMEIADRFGKSVRTVERDIEIIIEILLEQV